MIKKSLRLPPKELRIVGLEPDLIIPGVDLTEEECKGDRTLLELSDPFRDHHPTPELLAATRDDAVLAPVVVLKLGKYHYVVEGRCRTVAAREVGKDEIECVLVDSASALDVQSANTGRRDDDAIVKAKDLAKLRAQPFGYSPEETRKALGVSISQMKLYKQLLACSDEVLALVKNGRITLVIAYELGKYPKAEQMAKVQAVEAQQGTLKGEAGLANVRAATPGPVIVPSPLPSVDVDFDDVAPDPIPAPAPATPRPKGNVPLIKTLRLSKIQELRAVLDPEDEEPDPLLDSSFALMGVILGEPVDSLKAWPVLYNLARQVL